jgi:hypothetical protein
MNQFTLIWRIRWMLYSINSGGLGALAPSLRGCTCRQCELVRSCEQTLTHLRVRLHLHQVTALLIT